MTQVIPKSIALVDFSHMLTVNFKAMASDAGPNDAGRVTLNQLAAIRSASDHVIVCLDSPPYWRKKIYPEYKGKRAEREPEFGPIQKWTLERVELDGFNIARAPEHEADDVVRTLSKIYSEDYHCGDVRIVGADKDALQCVSDSVRLFVPKGRDEFDIRGPDWLLKEYAVKPEEFALLLAIMGDTSDNIPGIKGLGKGHGAKLIELYKNPAGMAIGLTAAVSDARLNDKKLSAVWERFAAGMAELPKWWKLTTLVSDAPLDKHPLKYLEKLPVQKLVEEPISDADDSAFIDPEEGEQEPEWDRIERETAERERAELAKALPVEPAKRSGFAAGELADQELAAARAPRIGKDPNAEKVLAEAATARLAAMNTDAPKTPERVAVTQARIDAGNAAERDRHGQERPKLPYDPKDYAKPTAEQVHAAHPTVPLESAKALVELGEQLGKEGLQATAQSLVDAARANGAASNGPPAAAAASQVVPPTQGPQAERMPMTVVPPPSWELATQPRSPSEMAIVATRFYNSRFYAAHGTADGTFAVLALGRELGLGVAASAEGFHIVNQRPFAKAVMLKALAERDPNCEWLMVTSADDKQCTIETKHRKIDKVLLYQYTIERAEKAGYLSGKNRENWLTKTQEMLEARATSKAVRRWYPGSTFGMHSVEEAGDD